MKKSIIFKPILYNMSIPVSKIYRLILNIPKFIIVLLCLNHTSFSQSVPPQGFEVGMTSPTAASIARFSDIPLNMYTGTFTYDIPLYEMQVGHLSIPLSLSFAHSGYKVGEVPGWIGMGWSLNAGGVITRTVFGKPDEDPFGYKNTGDRLEPVSQGSAWWMDCASSTNVDKCNDYFLDFDLDQIDPEPDVFFYSFMGISGKFNFGVEGGNIVNQDGGSLLKIEYEVSGSGDGIIKWVITDTNGNIYEFSKREYVRTKINGSPARNLEPSSWYLTKVKPYGTSHSATLHYSTEMNSHCRARVPTVEKITGYGNPPPVTTTIEDCFYNTYLDSIVTPNETAEFILSNTIRQDYIGEKKLSSITIQNRIGNTEIQTYDFIHDYISFGQLKKLIFKEIKIRNGTGITEDLYSFEYEESFLIDHNSNSFDHWGYYNKSNNNSMDVPKVLIENPNGTYSFYTGANREPDPTASQTGLMKTIHLPTGGEYRINYEPNNYSIDSNGLVDTLKSFREITNTMNSSICGNYEPGECRQKINFSVGGVTDVIFNLDILEGIVDPHSGREPVLDIVWIQVPTQHPINIPWNHAVVGNTLSPGDYELWIHIGTDHENLPNHQVKAKLEWVEKHLEKSIIAGGHRVKEIVTHDGLGQENKTLFKYNIIEDSLRSSGYVSHSPRYYDYDIILGQFRLIRKSNSLVPLAVTQGSYVGYGFVRQLNINNNDTLTTEHYFANYPDDIHPYPINESNNFANLTPTTSNASRRGYLTKKIVLDSDDNKLVEVLYHYQHTSGFSALGIPGTPALRFRSIPPPQQSGFPNFTVFGVYFQPSTWMRLTGKTTKTFDQGNQMLTSESYEYDSLTKNLIKTISINSNSHQRETVYKYAHEIEPLMLNDNLYSPKYSESIKNSSGHVLHKTWTLWSNEVPGNDNWLPNEIWRWTGSSPMDVTAPVNPNAEAIKIAEILTYDSWGNPISLNNASGLLTEQFYGSEGNPFSQNGYGNVQGVYQTGIRTSSSGVLTLEQSAHYNNLGQLIQMIDANEQNLFFNYDSLGRLIRIQGGSQFYKFPIQEYDYEISFDGISSYGQGNQNRIVSRSFTGFGSEDVLSQVQYFDGLGRPIQSQQGIGGNNAIVQHTFYDAAGRFQAETKPIIWSTGLQYKSVSSLMGNNWSPGLALPESGSDLYSYHYNTLGHSSDDSKYAYSQIQYKPDPLGRVDKQAAPGYIYRMGEGKEQQTDYGFNNTSGNNSHENFLGFSAGQLHKTTHTDENGNKSISFSDGWGRTISTGIDLAGYGDFTAATMKTGFEYDLLDNLTRVHEPRGFSASGFKREYNYNRLGLLIEENNPDMTASTEYRYDKAGNLRFVKNAEHKFSGNTFTNTLAIQQPGSSTLFSVPGNGALKLEIDLDTTIPYMEVALNLDVEMRDDSQQWISVNRNPVDTFGGGASNATRRTMVTKGNHRFNTQELYADGSWTLDLIYTFEPFNFSYLKYDELGRVIEVGEYSGNISDFTNQGHADNPNWPVQANHALVINDYDIPTNYSEARNLKGRLAQSRYLDPNTWSWSSIWYSYTNQGQVEWMRHQVAGLPVKLIEYNYNRQGQVTKMKYQKDSATERFFTWYEYDSAGRLERVYSATSDNENTRKLQAEYTYNADNQIKTKAVGLSPAGNAQFTDYNYHIRGWLTRINNPDNLTSSPAGFPDNRFAMELRYETQSTYGTNWEAQYNGNISQIRWNVTQPNPVSNDMPLYNFLYDRANRLKWADYDNPNTGTSNFDVRNITYDSNGNFTSLRRYKNSTASDLYTYSYYPETNRVRRTSGSVDQYKYDRLGNMNVNTKRDISFIGYDWRNLPYRIVQGNNLHQYRYDGEGNRVRKQYTYSNSQASVYIRGADGQVIAVYNGIGTHLYWNLPAGIGRVTK